MAEYLQPLATPSTVECPICMHSVSRLRRLECNHEFCSDCVEQLFSRFHDQQRVPCPTCRQEVTNHRGVGVVISGHIRCFECLRLDSIDKILWCCQCVKLICTTCDHPVQKGHSILGHSVDPWRKLTAVKHCSAALETMDAVQYLLLRSNRRDKKRLGYTSVQRLLQDTYEVTCQVAKDLMKVPQKDLSSYARVANTALQLAAIGDITVVAPEVSESLLKSSSAESSIFTVLCSQNQRFTSENFGQDRLTPQQKQTVLSKLPMAKLSNDPENVPSNQKDVKYTECLFHAYSQTFLANNQNVVILWHNNQQQYEIPDAQERKVRVCGASRSSFGDLCYLGLERINENHIELAVTDGSKISVVSLYDLDSALSSMHMPFCLQKFGLMYLSLSYKSSGEVLVKDPETHQLLPLNHEALEGRMGSIQTKDEEHFVVYNQTEGKIFCFQHSFYDCDPVLESVIDLSAYPNIISLSGIWVGDNRVRGKGDGYVMSSNFDGTEMLFAKVPPALQKARMTEYAELLQHTQNFFEFWKWDYAELENKSSENAT